MKKGLKFLTILLATVCAAACAVLFSACDRSDGKDDNPPSTSDVTDDVKDEKVKYTVTVVYEDSSFAKDVAVSAGGQSLTTDANGKAEFSLAKGTYALTVTAPQGYSVNGSYSFTETGKDVTVTLKENEAPSVTYRVTVKYPDDSYAIGVEVALNDKYSTVTDGSGVATFALPEGAYAVTVEAPKGYETVGTFSVSKASPDVTVNLSQIKNDYTVTVLYPDDTAASGVAVLFGTTPLTTDSKGKVSISVAGEGHKIQVTPPTGYKVEEEYTATLQNKDVVIKLTANEVSKTEYAVTVKLPDGNPAAGASVQFGDSEPVITGGDGIAKLKLTPDDYTVTVTLAGYVDSTVTLTEANPAATVNLVAPLQSTGGNGTSSAQAVIINTDGYGVYQMKLDYTTSESTKYFYFKLTSSAGGDVTVSSNLGSRNCYKYNGTTFSGGKTQGNPVSFTATAGTTYCIMWMMSSSAFDGTTAPVFTIELKEEAKYAFNCAFKYSDTNEPAVGFEVGLYEFVNGAAKPEPAATGATDANGLFSAQVYARKYVMKAMSGFPDGYDSFTGRGTVLTVTASSGSATLDYQLYKVEDTQINVYLCTDADSKDNPAAGVNVKFMRGGGVFSSGITDGAGCTTLGVPNDRTGFDIVLENVPQGYYYLGLGPTYGFPMDIYLYPVQEYSFTVKCGDTKLAGVKVSLMKDEEVAYSDSTDANGVVNLTGVVPYNSYTIKVENVPSGYGVHNVPSFNWKQHNITVEALEYDRICTGSGGTQQRTFTVQLGKNLCSAVTTGGSSSANKMIMNFVPTEAGTYLIKSNDSEITPKTTPFDTYTVSDNGWLITVAEDKVGSTYQLAFNCPSTGASSSTPYLFVIEVTKQVTE